MEEKKKMVKKINCHLLIRFKLTKVVNFLTVVNR